MSLLAAPPWLQAALGAEALAVAWLTARFGLRGLGWSLAGGVAFWFLLAFGGSWLVGRLEGAGPATAASLLPGAVEATLRLGAAAAPLIGAAAIVGGLARAALTRRRRPPR